VKSLIDKVKGGNYLPTPTGIENLDRLLGGGFINQQIIGITGRPGAGKTAFCQWLAESMAIGREDYCALYLCFEMSAEQLQARSISRLMHEAGENLTPLEVLQGKGQWLKGAQMYEDLYAKKVLYVGMGGGLQSNDITEVERVISECIRYKISQGQPVPFVVLDYLQIISVAGMNEFEAIGTIMARLKGLAVKYNAVILIVIANNRDSNKKGEFDMFSGRGSGSIEYGLDAMLSLVPETTEQGELTGEIVVNVAKGRWINPKAKAVFKFDGAHMNYTAVDAMGDIMSTREAQTAQDLFDGVKK
jgi:replicative DNA helicase